MGRNSTATRDADSVRQILLQSIASGEYQVGSRLPSVRVLDRKFGVKRNVAFKIYQEFVDAGWVEARQGAGYYLARSPEGVALSTPATLEQEMHPLLWKARAAGLHADEAIRICQEVLIEVYGTSRLQIGFVECTSYIASSISRELSRHLAFPVEPIVLSDLRHLSEAIRAFDMLATTFFHLREIEMTLEDMGTKVDVIGLKHIPATSTVLQIARMPRNARVGVICANRRTLRIAISMVDAYHGSIDWSGTSNEEPLVGQVLDEADVLVTSADSYDYIIQRLNGASRPQVIILNFEIEPESLVHLKNRVSEALQQRLQIATSY